MVLLLIAAAVLLGVSLQWILQRRARRKHRSDQILLDEMASKPSDPVPAGADTPEQQPNDAERCFLEGQMFQEQGDDRRAIDCYAKADQLGHAAAASNLGVLLERHGRPEAALDAYRRADQRGHSDGAFNLGALLEERGRLLEAAGAYDRADRAGDGAAACNLGILLLQQGNPDGAKAAFLRASQRGDAAGSLNLAMLLEDQGDQIGARRAYERAAVLDDGETGDRARAWLKRSGLSQTHTEHRLGG